MATFNPLSSLSHFRMTALESRIVSGSFDKSVRVCQDASTGVELKILIGHTSRVNSVAFSSDGSRIVSGSDDMSVRVWVASIRR
jgi:WD40 repeat protein